MEKFEKYINTTAGILSIITALMTILVGINFIFIFILGSILTLTFSYVYFKLKKIPKYTEIEGLRIEEADNIPLFISKKNQINPLKVTHICEIDGSNAILEYEYLGVCVDKNGMEYFSTCIHSHDISALEDTNWYGYDLRNDIQKKQKIIPQLQSPNGATKKVLFRFHKRIRYNELCNYYTYQEVKNSVKKTGKDYYVSTVLYKDRPLYDYQVILKFHKIKPININVYSVKNRQGKFLYKLSDNNMIIENDTYIYIDNIENENKSAWSIIVYIFDRCEECNSNFEINEI